MNIRLPNYLVRCIITMLQNPLNFYRKLVSANWWCKKGPTVLWQTKFGALSRPLYGIHIFLFRILCAIWTKFLVYCLTALLAPALLVHSTVQLFRRELLLLKNTRNKMIWLCSVQFREMLGIKHGLYRHVWEHCWFSFSPYHWAPLTGVQKTPYTCRCFEQKLM